MPKATPEKATPEKITSGKTAPGKALPAPEYPLTNDAIEHPQPASPLRDAPHDLGVDGGFVHLWPPDCLESDPI